MTLVALQGLTTPSLLDAFTKVREKHQCEEEVGGLATQS